MKKVTKSSRNHSARKTTVSKLKGVARVFQRGGGGESHWVIQRVFTRLSPEYCGLFADKKAYKGGGHGHPRTPLATPLKLKKPNVEHSDIVKVTGHPSVQSLDDYDDTDEEEQRRLASAISKRNYETPVLRKNEWHFPTSQQLWFQSLR